MRSSALRKEEFYEEPRESWESFRARIAKAAEEASKGSCDMEAFAEKYRLADSILA